MIARKRQVREMMSIDSDSIALGAPHVPKAGVFRELIYDAEKLNVLAKLF